MPLSSEAQREEKVIAKQAAVDEKHMTKDVGHAEKAEARHAKAIDRAIQKAISKGPGKLAKTERAHDSAVYHVQDAEKAIQNKQRQHVEMSHELK